MASTSVGIGTRSELVEDNIDRNTEQLQAGGGVGQPSRFQVRPLERAKVRFWEW